MTKVKYAELYGLRKAKYDFLQTRSEANTDWQEISPKEPFYFLVPKNDTGWDVYQKFWKITDIFPVNSVGIVTARDSLTIGWTLEDVWQRANAFANSDPEIARSVYKLGPDVRDWKVELAQKDLKDSGPSRDRIVPILYRPFDIRYTYYTGKTRGFHCMPRSGVMKHMLQTNIALLTCRQLSGNKFQHIFVSNTITDDSLVSNKTKERGYVFPLYVKPTGAQTDLFAPYEMNKGKQNINWNVIPQELHLSSGIIKTYSEQKKVWQKESILCYVYAILNSNIYREKYSEFLKNDFPKIPFTKDREVFESVARLGFYLIELHLLKSLLLDEPRVRLAGRGDNKIAKREFKDDQVWINATQYFEPVDQEVWGYFVGGYQVADKWLKDRQNRAPSILSSDEVKTYCQIVTALSETIKIQKEIDRLYPEVEKSLP